MSYSIDSWSNHVIVCRTIQFLRTLELHSETEKRKLRKFEYIILQNLGDSVDTSVKRDAPTYIPYSDCVDPDSVQFPDDDDPFMPDGTAIFENQSLTMDSYGT